LIESDINYWVSYHVYHTTECISLEYNKFTLHMLAIFRESAVFQSIIESIYQVKGIIDNSQQSLYDRALQNRALSHISLYDRALLKAILFLTGL